MLEPGAFVDGLADRIADALRRRAHEFKDHRLADRSRERGAIRFYQRHGFQLSAMTALRLHL